MDLLDLIFRSEWEPADKRIKRLRLGMATWIRLIWCATGRAATLQTQGVIFRVDQG